MILEGKDQTAAGRDESDIHLVPKSFLGGGDIVGLYIIINRRRAKIELIVETV